MFSSTLQQMNIVVNPINSVGGLYIGGQPAAENVKALLENKITAVISVLAGFTFKYPQQITHLQLQARDFPSYQIHLHFDQCIEFLNDHLPKTNVLIHCFAGASRSATIVLAYLMMKNGWSFNYSYNYLKQVRSIVQPNYGFIKKLKQFSHKLKNQPLESFGFQKKQKEPQKKQEDPLNQEDPMESESQQSFQTQ